jgi:hypothetical protein
VDRQHADAGGQQPSDEQPVGPLDRDTLDATLEQYSDQIADALLVGSEAPLVQQLAAVAVGDPDVVPLIGPVDSGDCGHARSSSVEVVFNRADQEVPWRVLIGRRSTAQRPVAALGASHRREAHVSRRPSTRQAPRALSRRWSALYAGQSEGTPGLRPGSLPINNPTRERNLSLTQEVAL